MVNYYREVNAMYTLGTAAKATGKSKTTIQKALTNGRISAAKNDIGEWQIDPAELHRVYPPHVPSEQNLTPEITLKIKALQDEVQRLSERLTDRDRLLGQMKVSFDREVENHETTKAALSDLRRLLPPPRPVPTQGQQGQQPPQQPAQANGQPDRRAQPPSNGNPTTAPRPKASPKPGRLARLWARLTNL